jgi:hypothetical protein
MYFCVQRCQRPEQGISREKSKSNSNNNITEHSFQIRGNKRQNIRKHAPFVSNSSDEDIGHFPLIRLRLILVPLMKILGICVDSTSFDLERWSSPSQDVQNCVGFSLSWREICSSSPAQLVIHFGESSKPVWGWALNQSYLRRARSQSFLVM